MAKFNGASLPAIPRHNMSDLPFLSMTCKDGTYTLRASDKGAVMNGEILFSGVRYNEWTCTELDEAWTLKESNKEAEEIRIEPFYLFWTNFDVEKTDGTVSFAGTAPIYERIETQTLVNGYLAGLVHNVPFRRD